MANNISKSIKYYRLGMGLSQEQSASRCEISQPAYAAYEAGKKVPKYESVKEIASAFGIHPLLIYDDDFNGNRGYFYKNILDNCADITQNEDGSIQVKFDSSYAALYDYYVFDKQNKAYIAEDYEKGSEEFDEKMKQQELMSFFFASTWPRFDYAYNISIGEETKPRNVAQRHARERFTEAFSAFVSNIRKSFGAI